jgi:hypothetical protein
VVVVVVEIECVEVASRGMENTVKKGNGPAPYKSLSRGEELCLNITVGLSFSKAINKS